MKIIHWHISLISLQEAFFFRYGIHAAVDVVNYDIIEHDERAEVPGSEFLDFSEV
jgi:hypothetical protein